jgi:hypothetical protein
MFILTIHHPNSIDARRGNGAREGIAGEG